MKKGKKIILIIFVVLIAIVGSAYHYINNAGKRDLSEEKAEFTVSSSQIMAEFTNNSDASTKKYLNKAIIVTGVVTDATVGEVVLDSNIICKLHDKEFLQAKGKKINVKGRFIGFDDLMGELKMDECFINN